MRAVDDVILDALRDAGLTVHDSYVEVDNDGHTVTYPLPFVVYYSNVGDDHNPRLDGRTYRRSVFFSITSVGMDRNQTKWAAEKVRATLDRQRFGVGGRRSWLCVLQESQRIRRDDDAIRPDGSPLFYGVDNYALSITKSPV